VARDSIGIYSRWWRAADTTSRAGLKTIIAIAWRSLATRANHVHMLASEKSRHAAGHRAEPERWRAKRKPLMKFRPLHDRVVIRRLEAEEKSKGGIVIPDTVKEKPQEGEVVAVGPGARDEGGKLVPLELEAGQRVLFGKWSGTEVKIDGQDLLIMKESDIMGVLEGAAAAKKKAA
jgi:chaperonin GroES